jgi:hypothetical protein
MAPLAYVFYTKETLEYSILRKMLLECFFGIKHLRERKLQPSGQWARLPVGRWPVPVRPPAELWRLR